MQLHGPALVAGALLLHSMAGPAYRDVDTEAADAGKALPGEGGVAHGVDR